VPIHHSTWFATGKVAQVVVSDDEDSEAAFFARFSQRISKVAAVCDLMSEYSVEEYLVEYLRWLKILEERQSLTVHPKHLHYPG